MGHKMADKTAHYWHFYLFRQDRVGKRQT